MKIYNLFYQVAVPTPDPKSNKLLGLNWGSLSEISKNIFANTAYSAADLDIKYTKALYVS